VHAVGACAQRSQHQSGFIDVGGLTEDSTVDIDGGIRSNDRGIGVPLGNATGFVDRDSTHVGNRVFIDAWCFVNISWVDEWLDTKLGQELHSTW
jgi:hypothetical protein